MLKKLKLLTLTILLILTLSSCISKSKNQYIVTFIYNNGEENFSQVVEESYVQFPDIPSKTNYIFEYWCIDEDLKTPFEFSAKITENITLYAKYNIDYSILTNEITTNTIKSFILLESTPTENNSNSIDISSGSGVVFKNYGDTYYILSNNHICHGTKEACYYVTDYLENRYEAELLYNDPNYDLSLLSFKSNTKYEIIELANDNPSVNIDTVCIGNPNGQRNAILYGKIKEYYTIPTSNFDTTKTNVKFETITHTANFNYGASGGPLLDVNLKLIGINFASAKNNSGEIISNHAIPINKIIEFLNVYNFEI